MKPLLVATTNAGKLAEFEELLAGVFSVRALDKSAPKIIEDGNSYRANAEKKARGYFAHYQVPILSDDSGLEVDLLGGRPGVDSAYYGGEGISWPERWKLLHSELNSYPESQWVARFRCVLCYFDGSAVEFFEGTVEGRILPEPLGKEGFGYDPIFFSNDLKKGFGEALKAEKAKVSHRARAAQAFKSWAINQP